MRRPAKPARPTADQDLSRAVGFMTIPFRNGEYQGEFKIGRRVGKGTFTWHNSDVLKEFRRAMPLLGLEAPAAEVDALYKSWDADGSGLIEVKELQRLLRRGQTMELDVSVASARQIQEQARARAAAG